MWRHKPPSPPATRVVSRNPMPASGSASSRCMRTSAAASACGRWLMSQMSESCCSGDMRTVRMSPGQHDSLICDISHLPHALAAALVRMQRDEALPLAGMGFLDTTRVAGGDGGLWRDIFQDNRDNLADSLRRLHGALDELENLLDPARGDDLRRWLDEAAQRRAELLEEKLREISE